jgi:hypothetical protein
MDSNDTPSFVCHTRHCEENLLFWLEAEDFKNIPGTDYMKIRAKKICSKYVTEDSKQQVSESRGVVEGAGLPHHGSDNGGRWRWQINIDHKTREALLAQLENPTHNIFHKVGRSEAQRGT